MTLRQTWYPKNTSRYTSKLGKQKRIQATTCKTWSTWTKTLESSFLVSYHVNHVNSQTLRIYCSKGIPCLQLCCINPSTPPKECSLATADLTPVALCSAQELLRPRQAGLHNAGRTTRRFAKRASEKSATTKKCSKKMCFHQTGLLWLLFLPSQLPRFSHVKKKRSCERPSVYSFGRNETTTKTRQQLDKPSLS